MLQIGKSLNATINQTIDDKQKLDEDANAKLDHLDNCFKPQIPLYAQPEREQIPESLKEKQCRLERAKTSLREVEQGHGIVADGCKSGECKQSQEKATEVRASNERSRDDLRDSERIIADSRQSVEG